MEEHEKTVSMGLIVLMVIIITIVFVVIALQWTEGQELIGTSIEFNSLCVQWQYDDCDENLIEEIENDKFTLTEECLKLFDMGSDTKTITLCQDICKNKCNPQISYDIAVYKENIIFLNSNKIQIEILNLGSGSVFGAYIKITGKGAGPEEILYTGPVNVPSHGSWIKILEPEEPITYVKVDMDDYKDSSQNNNIAENKLL